MTDDPSSIDKYVAETREHYKSAEAAEAYDRTINPGLNLRELRGRVITAAERRAIIDALTSCDVGHVLDLPCGTGKLAPVLSKLAARVTSADVSPAMIELAKRAYAKVGFENVVFRECDATRVSRTITKTDGVTVVVSLRLFHRTPIEVTLAVLKSMRELDCRVVATFARASRWHSLRRRAMAWNYHSNSKVTHNPLPDNRLRELAAEAGFIVVRSKGVLPALSQEVVVVLDPI